MTRRAWLGLLAAAGGLLVGGIVAIPAAITGLSPALHARRRHAWRAIGPLDDFPIGQVQRTEVTIGDRDAWPRPLGQQAVYVWRPTAADLVVLSRHCTDLACPLNFDPGSQCFFCPCHGGIFAKDGSVMAGPPNRPMDRYAHRVRDGVVEIDLASVPLAM